MTISYVGAGTFGNVATGNLTLTEPAGCQEGDLLVAFINVRNPGAITVTQPAGWTSVRYDTVNDGNNRAALYTAYIERGAATPADRTFVPSANATMHGTIIAIRSTRGKISLDTSNGISLVGVSTSVTSTGITTARANEFLVMGCAADDDTTTASAQGAATDPTSGSWTEQVETSTTTGVDANLAIATATKSSAGATGNLSWTASVTGRHAISTLAFFEEYRIIAGTGNYSISGQTVADPVGLTHEYLGGTTFTPPAGGSTVNINNVNSGAADPERRLLIGVVHRNSGTNPGSNLVTGMTVDGVAATRLVEAGTSANVSWWLTDKIPSGTDVDIAITTNASVSLSANIFGKIHVYRVIGSGSTATDTLADTGTSGADDPTGAIDEARFGINFVLTVGGVYQTNPATHAQPSGYVEDSQTSEAEAGDAWKVANSVASKWNGAAATNVTTSVNVTNGTGSSNSSISMVVVALRYGLNDPSLAIDSGSFSYTGQDVTLRPARRLPIDFGSFAHSGQAVTLLANRILRVDFGTYTYIGQDVQMRKEVTVIAETGIYVYTGGDVDLFKTRRNNWIEDGGTTDAWTETINMSSGWVEDSPITDAWSEDV